MSLEADREGAEETTGTLQAVQVFKGQGEEKAIIREAQPCQK